MKAKQKRTGNEVADARSWQAPRETAVEETLSSSSPSFSRVGASRVTPRKSPYVRGGRQKVKVTLGRPGDTRMGQCRACVRRWLLGTVSGALCATPFINGEPLCDVINGCQEARAVIETHTSFEYVSIHIHEAVCVKGARRRAGASFFCKRR